MAQKNVHLPGIGPVILAKRRGAKNFRLSITPSGQIRVGMPNWVPYSAGIKFALQRRDWIRQNSAPSQPGQLKDGSRIGKSYRLKFVPASHTNTTSARLGINSITITSHLELAHEQVQQKARKAAERALKKEAQILLGGRLAQMATAQQLAYKDIKIKRLTSRWGSCTSSGVISINYFLIQLPWHLIDYVLAHELAHTVYLNHSRQFWQLLEGIIPDAKARRREIKSYRPVLLPQR